VKETFSWVTATFFVEVKEKVIFDVENVIYF